MKNRGKYKVKFLTLGPPGFLYLQEINKQNMKQQPASIQHNDYQHNKLGPIFDNWQTSFFKMTRFIRKKTAFAGWLKPG